MDVKLVAGLSQVVETNLRSSQYYVIIGDLLSRINVPVFLLGGSVRDPIIKHIHGKDIVTNDFDFLIDDSRIDVDLVCLANGFDYILNRFGHIKLRPIGGLEVDLFTVNQVAGAKNLSERSVVSVVSSCDLSTSALAYDPRNSIVYSCNALDDIRRKQVNVLNTSGDDLDVILCRLILHSQKLGFSVGGEGVDFVKSNYSLNSHLKIKWYLDYKGKSSYYDLVISELERIKKS